MAPERSDFRQGRQRESALAEACVRDDDLSVHFKRGLTRVEEQIEVDRARTVARPRGPTEPALDLLEPVDERSRRHRRDADSPPKPAMPR